MRTPRARTDKKQARNPVFERFRFLTGAEHLALLRLRSLVVRSHPNNWCSRSSRPSASNTPVRQAGRALLCRDSAVRLESKFQRSLKRARATFLEQWVQTAQALVQHSERFESRRTKLNCP